MAAEQENECNGKGSVENEACQGVLAEQKLAELMVSCCICLLYTSPSPRD